MAVCTFRAISPSVDAGGVVSTGNIAFVLFLATFSACAQTSGKTRTGVEVCAEFTKTNAEQASAGRPQFSLPEQCYPAKTLDFTNKPSPQGLEDVLTLMQ